jgi:hypothetical protein
MPDETTFSVEALLRTRQTTCKYFGDLYDTSNQAKHLPWDNSRAFRLFLGRLRLDAFLFKTVAIHDAYLIDSRFFWVSAANASFLAELPLERIIINIRSQTLEEAILRSFIPSGRAFKDYIVDSFSNETAKQVACELPRQSIAGRNTPGKIADLISEIAGHTSETEVLREGWNALIALDQSGRLQKNRWGPPKRFAVLLATLLDSSAQDVLKVLTPDGKDVFARFSEIEFADRSKRIAFLRNELVDSPRHAEDIATIESWYVGAYNLASAANNGCDIRDIHDVLGSKAFNDNQRLFDYLSLGSKEQTSILNIDYPADLVFALGQLSKDEFDKIAKEQQAHLNLWYEELDVRALEAAVSSLARSLENVGYKGEQIPSWAAPALSFVTTVATGALVALAAHQLASMEVLKGTLALAGAGVPKAIEKMVEDRTKAFATRNPHPRRIVQRAELIRRNSEG